jgi:hypothetical protein
MQVIAQVKGEFRVRGYGVTLSKSTINRYVALGMVGTFPLARGYVGTMPRHAFDLLVLAVELFIQICNVNSINAEWSKLMMAINTCCSVAPSECRTKHSIYDSNKNSWREVGAVPHMRKCLTNSKVRHNGTDERDPNFDAYHDVQSQNDYSTTQLNVMGYRGDVLRAQFCPDKISKRRKALGPVTVANTRERQEALAAAHTHGKKFLSREANT